MRRYLGFILGCVALALLLGLVTGSSRAASNSKVVYHPPILPFSIGGPRTDQPVVGPQTVQAVIGLFYEGSAPYPEIRNRGNTIPLVQVKLYLPAGIKIVSSKFKLTFVYGAHVPKSNLHYTLKSLSGGTHVATWNYYSLKATPVPAWYFSVNRPPDVDQHCLTATETFPGVKYAPKQTAKACFQGSSSS